MFKTGLGWWWIKDVLKRWPAPGRRLDLIPELSFGSEGLHINNQNQGEDSKAKDTPKSVMAMRGY